MQPSLRFSVAQLAALPPGEAAPLLRSLAESFQDCQAVQARVIDAVAGRLSGRDAGLREQVLRGRD